MKRPAKVSQDMLLAELEIAPMTALECARFLGVVKRNANVHIRALRLRGVIEGKRVRIVEWVSGVDLGRSGYYSPVYSFSRGLDVPAPQKMTAAQTTKRHRQKFRAVHRIKRRNIVSPWAGLLVT